MTSRAPSSVDRILGGRSERVKVSRRVVAVEERYDDTDLAQLWGCSARSIKRLRESGELGPVWLLAGRPCVGARGVQAYESLQLLSVSVSS